MPRTHGWQAALAVPLAVFAFFAFESLRLSLHARTSEAEKMGPRSYQTRASTLEHSASASFRASARQHRSVRSSASHPSGI